MVTTSLVGTLDSGFPQGIVRDGASYNDVDNIVFRPILLTYRGCEVSLRGIDLSRMDVVTTNANINGTPCWHLRQTRGRNTKLRESLWLNPLQDFVVVRYVEGVAENPFAQVDIDYDVDSSGVPVPTSWNAALLASDGTILESYGIEVKDYQINHDIDSTQFHIDFPVGTWVDDRQKGGQFLVQQDGPRPITPAELRRGVSYEELLSSETGEAGISQWKTSSRVLWTVSLVAAVVVVALVAWRRMLV
jgi:hypothetical protein